MAHRTVGGGINSMHSVKNKKKKICFTINSDNPSKKEKITLGPQEQDRLKVIMNKYLFLLSQCSSSKFFQERVELKMIYKIK